ncbi:hypothetical protein BGX26_005082, partial [Mortierella sp. AD094]
MTGLHQLMVRKLWCKDAVRLGKSAGGNTITPNQINKLRPKNIDKLMATEIQHLGYLAFKGLENNYQTEFDEEALLDTMMILMNPYSSEDISLQAWYFLHLTFQEFFAATWIAQRLKVKKANSAGTSPMMKTIGETTAFVQKHKYDPRYEIVWWMVAGLLEGDALKGFFDIIQGGPQDMLGGRHQQLLASCLKEARSQLDHTMKPRSKKSEAKTDHFNIRETFQFDFTCRSRADQDFARQDWHVRSSAAKALGSQSTLSESAIHGLISALQDNDNVRDSAAKALGAQSTLSESAIQGLIVALQDENSWYSAEALGAHSILSESASHALIGGLQHVDVSVRYSVASVLCAQSTLSESVIQALIGTLQDDYRDVRDSATKALGAQSTLSESAIQALIGALQDEIMEVRFSAAEALGAPSTLSESAIQALIVALLGPYWRTRDSAVKALDRH